MVIPVTGGYGPYRWNNGYHFRIAKSARLLRHYLMSGNFWPLGKEFSAPSVGSAHQLMDGADSLRFRVVRERLCQHTTAPPGRSMFRSAP